MLTPREREILACVVQGRNDAEVANELFVSQCTVRVHKFNIREKLGCRNDVELALWALNGDGADKKRI